MHSCASAEITSSSTSSSTTDPLSDHNPCCANQPSKLQSLLLPQAVLSEAEFPNLLAARPTYMQGGQHMSSEFSQAISQHLLQIQSTCKPHSKSQHQFSYKIRTKILTHFNNHYNNGCLRTSFAVGKIYFQQLGYQLDYAQ